MRTHGKVLTLWTYGSSLETTDSDTLSMASRAETIVEA